MRTVYLVVTTPDLRRIAVVSGPGGWQLPRWDRQKRIPPASDARDPLPLADRISPTHIVHWSQLPPRDADDTDGDMYCLAVLDEPSSGSQNDRHVGPPDFVLMNRERALSPGVLTTREQLAVGMALTRTETPVVTFDSREEVRAAIAWAERQIADTTAARITAVARYRHERRDLIVRFETDADAVYLKAGKQRFADEAILTQHLHALLPHQVPETIAADPLTHRWLYRELPGVMMSSAPIDHDTIVAAVRALVSLQQATIGSAHIERHVAARRQTAVDLFHAVDSYVERAWRSVRPSDDLAAIAGTWGSLREAMMRACATVDRLDVPLALVPSDYWSQNILITPHGIGLIDLGYSFWSNPVLPLWRFVRDTNGRTRTDAPIARESMRSAIGKAFVDAWSGMVPARVMTSAIAQLWLIGRLFGIQIAAYDLDLTEESLGLDLPPGYKAARLAARVRDLSRALAQQVVIPRLSEPELAAALDL